MKATSKTLRLTVQNEHTDDHKSVFRSAGKRRAILTYTGEIQGASENEGAMITFSTYFT